MKRVLIFSIAYYPRFVGGAEVAIKEITDRLSDREFTFDLITLKFDSNLPSFERIGNVNIHRIGFTTKNPDMSDLVRFPLFINKYFFPFWAFLKARKLNKKHRYDAVWGMMANYAGFSALFFKLVNPKIPFLLTLQEGDPFHYIKSKVRLIYPLFVRIFRKADCIQAISHYLADFARDMGYQKDLFVVPNGVNIKRFGKLYTKEELETQKNIFKKHITGNRFLFTASRLVPKNGIDDCIRALKLLPEDISLIIAGIGPQEKELKDLVEKEGLSRRVLFLGYVDHDKLPLYLKSADIFIRPSLSEGLGISFIEAMAAEVPIIATPVGGIPDFLTDKETGVFCEAKNPKSIKDATLLILEDDVLRDRIVGNARRLVAREYEWDIVAETMRDKVFKVLFKNDREKK